MNKWISEWIGSSKEKKSEREIFKKLTNEILI